MKWLEIIELRLVRRHLAEVETGLEKLISETGPGSGAKAVKVYHHISLDTDFCIHLFHDSGEVDKLGSVLGLLLASALKEFGLVNHNVWGEKF